MKTPFLILSLIFIAFQLNGQTIFSETSGSFTSDSKLPDVITYSPNGGESLNYEQPLEVTWLATDDSFGANPISIGIITYPESEYDIVSSGLPNSGSATVATPGVFTSYAKTNVTAVDVFGNTGVDESDGYFTFNESFSMISSNTVSDSKPPEVLVVAPNGGEDFYYADPLQVEWTATDDSFGPTPVTISISTDGGTIYNDLASGITNTSPAILTAPEISTEQAIVRVFAQDEFGLAASDESDAMFTLHGIYIDVKAFLEGSFESTEMLTQLNSLGYLPISQPYNGAPWNYGGTENADPIPNPDVVDWVMVELREAPNAESAIEGTMIAQQAGFILKGGSVKDIDGNSTMQFLVEVNDNLFALLYHRNHVSVMSANPLTETAGIYSYDFSTGAANVYGGGNAHKQIVSGIWGMLAADGNADGNIDNKDKNDIWLPGLSSSGYLNADFDMDGTVHTDDKENFWAPNIGA
ncbi:MAG: hypothetical protein DRJ05_12885, partial [Bacteroidetes bacterium]